MIAVVSCPAERQFRQIACADDDAAELICLVHENLRALPRLCIFIGHIMHVRRLPDVSKMLHHTCTDVDLRQCRAVCLCKRTGVIVCSVRRTEAGHGYGLNAAPVKSEHIKSVNCHNERERRIQSARKTEHSRFASDMAQPCHQTDCLHREDFLTPAVQRVLIRRHKRRFCKCSVEGGFGDVQRKICRMTARGCRIGVHPSALIEQFLNVNICDC